jgi:3-deoxy-D-manno-octulosonic-acid transferase
VWWYNIGVFLYSVAIHLATPWNRKASLWIDGRKGVFEKLSKAVSPEDRVIWFHAASLGEFEQGRPLMEQVRLCHPSYKIMLTFFSPSGYEIRKDYKGADWVFYLPTDRPCRVRKFLDAVHPEIAVFIKYEFWLNYLRELGRRGIRTYLISSIFRKNSIFFRPWGGAFRKALGVFDRLFVQNAESKELLSEIGITRVEIAGDTRFDRVIAIAESPTRIECVEEFTAGRPTMVAGSTWAPDEEVLGEVIRRHPEMRFVVAPHEMNEERIRQMQAVLGGNAVRYSECVEGRVVPAASRVMIVDTFGILSTLYRYGRCAYVGGGFGTGIHNILEAVAYGLPVAFGPNCERFREARDLRGKGVATVISNADGLDEWLKLLVNDPEHTAQVKLDAENYIAQNRGATQKIMKALFGDQFSPY